MFLILSNIRVILFHSFDVAREPIFSAPSCRWCCQHFKRNLDLHTFEILFSAFFGCFFCSSASNLPPYAVDQFHYYIMGVYRRQLKMQFRREQLATCVGWFFNESFRRDRDGALFTGLTARGTGTHTFTGAHSCRLLPTRPTRGIGNAETPDLYLLWFFLFFFVVVFCCCFLCRPD